MVVATLDLFAMLIAMTFNGVYFAAVVLGYGLSTLLLGHLKENYQRHVGTWSNAAAAADVELCCAVAPTAGLAIAKGVEVQVSDSTSSKSLNGLDRIDGVGAQPLAPVFG